ncbi:hypothetical protein E3N88_05947 [Mikania micrantha]|uniref:Transmembrane protein n=1 Tax=Mikania micrantha TaxID=192012 RepID=A0A5N6PN42_9ASTR|nr:hypothetical protein E3N88_05947 [Mikania micrantha]
MESTLLLSPRFLSLQSREISSNVRQFQTSVCGRLNGSTQFTRNIAYTNHRSSFKITSLFSIGKKKVKEIKRETVVPDPDYRIPTVLLGLAGGLVYGDNLIAAAPVGLLGLLLLFQTTRVRFVFDDEALRKRRGRERFVKQKALNRVTLRGKRMTNSRDEFNPLRRRLSGDR